MWFTTSRNLLGRNAFGGTLNLKPGTMEKGIGSGTSVPVAREDLREAAPPGRNHHIIKLIVNISYVALQLTTIA